MKLNLWIATAGLLFAGHAAAANEASPTPSPTADTSTSQPSPQADNTGRNKDKQQINADQQGNSRSDVELVARIRKAVLADEALSVNAQNVKIVSKDGTVHLDGVVSSQAEKRKVEGIVREAADGLTVHSQLEIAGK